MKSYFYVLELLFCLILLSSCQKGDKVISTTYFNNEECIETYYVITDVINGEEIKTPCGKHTIETQNGVLLAEWTDKYYGPGDSYKNSTKFYVTETDDNGKQVHYVYMESEEGEGWSKTKNYHLVNNKVRLEKEEEWKDDGGESIELVKLYHDNGKLASKVKTNGNGEIVFSEYYNEDGKKLSLSKVFGNSLNKNIVYKTSIYKKKTFGGYYVSMNEINNVNEADYHSSRNWCLVFFPKNNTEGKVTLLSNTIDMKRYYESEFIVYRYIIEDDNILIHSGVRIVKPRGDNTPVADIRLKMSFGVGGNIQLTGLFKEKNRIFTSTSVDFDIKEWEYNN